MTADQAGSQAKADSSEESSAESSSSEDEQFGSMEPETLEVTPVAEAVIAIPQVIQDLDEEFAMDE